MLPQSTRQVNVTKWKMQEKQDQLKNHPLPMCQLTPALAVPISFPLLSSLRRDAKKKGKWQKKLRKRGSNPRPRD
jgi:hypothetical protein